jgi:hypothetical protein
MVLDWTVGENGEPKDEIVCGQPASFSWCGTMMCEKHANDAVENGDAHLAEIESLGKKV